MFKQLLTCPAQVANEVYLVSQMDRSYIEDDPEERELMNEAGLEERMAEKSSADANPLGHMDFYQADPFPHCQNERMYESSRINRHFQLTTFIS